jgi:hypothetical protein
MDDGIGPETVANPEIRAQIKMRRRLIRSMNGG